MVACWRINFSVMLCSASKARVMVAHQMMAVLTGDFVLSTPPQHPMPRITHLLVGGLDFMTPQP